MLEWLEVRLDIGDDKRLMYEYCIKTLNSKGVLYNLCLSLLPPLKSRRYCGIEMCVLNYYYLKTADKTLNQSRIQYTTCNNLFYRATVCNAMHSTVTQICPSVKRVNC